MQFRRSGQRDERRRRMLRDEHPADGTGDERPGDSVAECPSDETAGSSVGKPPKRYNDAALPERQPRITDLIPTRRLALALWIVLVVAVGTAIECLYIYGYNAAEPWLAQESMAALDVTRLGSLASWLGSLLLGSAAVASSVVFMLRRHKVDDYRAHYRLWLWTAAALLVASVDVATGIHDLAAAAIFRLSGWFLLGGVDAWWVLGWTVAFGGLAMRVFWDVRASRGAAVSLSFAVTAYVTAAALHLRLIPIPDPLAHAVTQSSLTLFAHLLVLLSIGCFARFVMLDAQGRLPERQVRRRRRKQTADATNAETDGENNADDTPHSQPESESEAPEESAQPTRAASKRKTRTDKPHRRKKQQPTNEPEPVAADTAAVDSDPPSEPHSQSADDSAALQFSSEPVLVGGGEEDDDDDSTRRLSKAERRRLRKQKRRR